ncbi:hypothetical protein [Marinobacterium lutimaris]|uniref:Uncharacterized protein n=1 Tax=Marinobacterium lutimaris TaxID=568106 RepID=A0A1H5YBH2_9GAMM|nr:hypothetical protein [Marinobacterium lutimaris]SEG20997.1 hypothetical protein SAMN05444390_1011681 [Marinobacterium lutimaris]
MSRVAKKVGPDLVIKHPGLKPCTSCNGGVGQGAVHEYTCAACNALGWQMPNGDPIPEDQANDILARLAHSLDRRNSELESENRKLRSSTLHLGSKID